MLEISASLKTVIDRAIAFHPRERFSTALEMLQALQTATPFPATVPFQPQVAVTSNQPTQSLSQQQNTKFQKNKSIKQSGISLQSIMIGSVIGGLTIVGLWLLTTRNITPQPGIKAATETEFQDTTNPEPPV